jgi:hypothetical protein
MLLDYLEIAIDYIERASGNIFLPTEIDYSAKVESIDMGGFYPIQSIEATFNGEPIDVNFIGGRVTHTFEQEGELAMTITCGYEKLPATVKGAIYLFVGDLFKNPENRVDAMEMLTGRLIKSFRRWQM